MRADEALASAASRCDNRAMKSRMLPKDHQTAVHPQDLPGLDGLLADKRRHYGCCP